MAALRLEAFGKAGDAIGLVESVCNVKAYAVRVVELAIARKFAAPTETRPGLACRQQVPRAARVAIPLF